MFKAFFFTGPGSRGPASTPRAAVPAIRALFRTGIAIAASSFIAGPLRAAEPDILYWPDGDGTAGNDSYFCRAIDFDGNLMVVGAPGANAAYVFEFIDAGWQYAAALPTPGGDVLSSEMQLAVDGSFIAVGMPSMSVAGIGHAGAVYVFAQGETGAGWREAGRLTADVPLVEGQFGRNVEFEDGRILVSGWSRNDPAGYLFERNASGEWVLARKFAGEDGSGLVVDEIAIDGDRIAFAHDDAGVYVYERAASGWVLGDVLATGAARTVALEGDVLVVGSPYEAIGENPRLEGVAYVFERASGEWQQVARLHSSREDALGYFGTRLDMQDGLLVVGEGHETGAVYAFRKDEAGNWVQFADSFKGSLHGMVHVPAISARAMAIGYSVISFSNVELFNVAELMNEAAAEDPDNGDEEPGDDPPDVTDPGNTGPENDDSGNVGNDSGDTASSDDSPGTADSDGDATSNGATNPLASGSSSAGTESAEDSGGGAIGGLAVLLALLRKRTGESNLAVSGDSQAFNGIFRQAIPLLFRNGSSPARVALFVHDHELRLLDSWT